MIDKMPPVEAKSTWETYGTFQISNDLYNDLNR